MSERREGTGRDGRGRYEVGIRGELKEGKGKGRDGAGRKERVYNN